MMKITMNHRVYVQMRPDADSLEELAAIGRSLPAQRGGRLMPTDELHVTVIHFGKVADAYAKIAAVVPIDEDEYLRKLEDYVEVTARLLTDRPYAVTPHGYARFGAHGSTLVGRYDPPDKLVGVHAAAYEHLLGFFASCGIADPQGFAGADPNFKVARSFVPHVTLYKGYDGPAPERPLPAMTLRFMRLVYEKRTR